MLPLQTRVDLGAMAIKGYSDCLVLYPGHSLGESYPSAEMQSVYSAATAEWAINYLNPLHNENDYKMLNRILPKWKHQYYHEPQSK